MRLRRLGFWNIICFCVVFLMYGCEKTSEEVFYDVPEEFEPFVELFIQEAKSRGIDLEIENLIIAYDDEMDDAICGSCNSRTPDANLQKIILINANICWISDLQKEALLFHELGHCILGRDHEATQLPNGDPKSMMIKDNISIYSGCIYAFGDTDECNFVFKRPYYLDELFDETTSVPDWAK